MGDGLDTIIDQKARDDAREALAKVAASEQMNAERWRQVEKSMVHLDGAISRVNNRLTNFVIGTSGTIIITCLAIIAWLITQLYNVSHH